MILSTHHKWVGYLVITIALFHAQPAKAQFKENKKDLFGASVYHDLNGLMRERSMISGVYNNERRTFELGLVISHLEAPSGVMFRHQLFLNPTAKGQYYDTRDFSVRPYLAYHFMYNGGVPEHDLQRNISEGFVPANQELSQNHTFSTIEHYLGLGLEADLLSHLFLNVYVGAGLYFYRHGSRIVHEQDMLLPEQLTGFNWSVSLGMGYRFQ